MNFAFSDEQQALRDQARKFLSDRAAPARVRRILESDEPFDRELWRGIGELAWSGTAIPESYGGAGFGYLELCVLAEELGRSLAPTPFSSSVYLATEALLLAGTDPQKKRWLPKLALGEAIGCFALAEGPRAPHAGNIETAARGGRLTGAKVPVADGDVADFAVVVARSDDGVPALFLVELGGAGVTRARVETMDPTRSHARLAFDGAAAEPLGAAGAGWALVRAAARPRGGAASPSSRWAARRPRSTWRATTRWAASPSAGPSLVPGHQAQARRHVHRDRARALERVLRGVGALHRRRRAPGGRGGSRACQRDARPTSTRPRRTSRPTAAWASRGSSTATCTTAAPSCSR